MDYELLLPILIPIIAGLLLLVASALPGNPEKHKNSGAAFGFGYKVFTCLSLALTVAAVIKIAAGEPKALQLITLVEGISLRFKTDMVAILFSVLVSTIWLLVGIYAFAYMEHEGGEKRFFGFYLVVLGVLEALCFAGNLVTYYMFFELMTLSSFPMVLHNGSRESIMAALKYVFYSMFGAYAALFGIFVLNKYCNGLEFVAKGSLNITLASQNKNLVLFGVFLMLVGFGVKAGMAPFHAWLPTAHPVAPSPASAVLSAIIAKFGVLGIIRTVFFLVGPGFIKGTWVQTTWLVLAMITVFMGSMLAFREQTFKKRLAYSTVSQVSYILLGLAILTETAFTGALLHVIAHGVIKSGLFLTAGVFIYKLGYTKVNQLEGLGKKMPMLFWSYTFLSLGLIGIPPTAGFVSKWYLALGSLGSNLPVISWLAVAILLVSALLTAGYLLPITMKGFFRAGEEGKDLATEEAPLSMVLPIAILAAVTVLMGILPKYFVDYIATIAKAVLR